MEPSVQRPAGSKFRVRALSARMQALIVLSLVVAGAVVVWAVKPQPTGKAADLDTAISSQSKRTRGLILSYRRPVGDTDGGTRPAKVFRSEHVTEGKIAVDEDRSTPIFSPYAGRVTKLFVKPGDIVSVGQTLFTVEATDMVQAQNDFITASTALNKARSTLNLAQINDKRQRLLYEGKAVPLKEVQQAQGTLDSAENDVRSADVALEAARNRLRILGKTDQEITEFQTKARSTRPPRSTPDLPGRSCSARSDRGNMSDAARAIRSSSSVTCRPSGWRPISARPRRRWCMSVSRSTSRSWPIRIGLSRPNLLCRNRARSHHATAAGAGIRRQRRGTAQARDVRQREDPHRRRRNRDRGPA